MRLYQTRDSLSDRQGFYRWRSAVALGDSAAVARERQGFGTLPTKALVFVLGMAQSDGVGVGDAILADSILAARATSSSTIRWPSPSKFCASLHLSSPPRRAPAWSESPKRSPIG